MLAALDVPRTLDLTAVTGIEHRRVYESDPAGYESSMVLASRAIEDCLARSEHRLDDLDVVICTSITRTDAPGRFCFAPSFAAMVCAAAGATPKRTFDLSNACAGMVTGVMVLDRMIRNGVVRNGMVFSGEQITPIAETAAREMRETYDPQFAALTVGDAAVAVVLDDRGDADDALHYAQIMTTAAAAEYCIGMPSDKAGGMAMYTDNRAMHTEQRYLQGIVRMGEFLRETGRTWATEEFDFWIQHQFSAPAIDYITGLTRKHFGTPMPTPLNILRDFGNTASTSHFLALHEHLKSGHVPKGSKVLMIPSASGMVYGCLSVTISRLQG